MRAAKAGSGETQRQFVEAAAGSGGDKIASGPGSGTERRLQIALGSRRQDMTQHKGGKGIAGALDRAVDPSMFGENGGAVGNKEIADGSGRQARHRGDDDDRRAQASGFGDHRFGFGHCGRLRHAGKPGAFEPVGHGDVGQRQQAVADPGGDPGIDIEPAGVAQHRVAQVERTGIGGLDGGDEPRGGLHLAGGGKITGQDRGEAGQADRGIEIGDHAFEVRFPHDRGGGRAVAEMVGDGEGRQRPDGGALALQHGGDRPVADTATHDMAGDGEDLRRGSGRIGRCGHGGGVAEPQSANNRLHR